MPQLLGLGLIALPIMLVLDLTWIGVIANSFYRTQLGSLYATHIVWQAAVAFYVVYILGMVFFVISPAVSSHSLVRGLLTAAFFALVAYGTYDLTSLAVTTNWPVALTFVDMAWGILCAIVTTAATYFIATKFFGF